MLKATVRGRKWLRATTVVIAAAVLVAVTGCGSTESSDRDSLVVASYGGSFEEAQSKAYFEPFAEKSGIDVKPTQVSSYDKVKAMVNTGQVDWDVVSAESQAYTKEAADGLLEPLDYDKIEADGIPDELKQEYGIGYLVFGQNMAWSKDKFPSGLTPAQFFDPSVKARRVLPSDPYYTLEFALLGDGVKPADLYPLDVDRAFDALARIKGQVVGFKGAADQQALIQQREVDAAYIPNARIENAISAGANWGYTWDASLSDTEWWVVPKGAPNVAAAMEFIGYATSAESQAAMSDAILYGPTNVDAFKFIDKERATLLPGNPKYKAQSAIMDAAWWGENLDKVKPRWDKWVLNQ